MVNPDEIIVQPIEPQIIIASAGAKGAQGITGTQGIQGVQGVQGLQGAQGVQGTQGLQGLQGVQGQTGTQGFTGSQGTIGATGAQGIQGIQGLEGLQGVQGTQGTQGTQGLEGLQGTQGLQGLQGVQGTIGSQGTTGTQGLEGLQGTQGTTGAQGVEGAQGHTGTQGLIGIQGSEGLQGIQGLEGLQGLTGTQGAIGIQGAQGVQGLEGAQGTIGVQGLQGLIGLQGIQGLLGAQGVQGAVGAGGSLAYYGSFYDTTNQTPAATNTAYAITFNATAEAFGVSIDPTIKSRIKFASGGTYNIQFSMQITSTTSSAKNMNIWLRKNGTNVADTNTDITIVGNSASYVPAWNWVLTLAANDYLEIIYAVDNTGLTINSGLTPLDAGPAIPSIILTATQVAYSIQGANGATGAQGAIGAQGTDGLNGAQGIQGIEGHQGTVGQTGAQGSIGLQGIQGNDGAQGSTGAQGITGTQGIEGIQGTEGAQGLIGIQGSTGAQGAAGYIGADGAQGTQGIQGLQGLQGIQGVTGADGAQGTQGIQGLEGSQGSVGSIGAQGVQGTTGIQGTQGIQGEVGLQGAVGLQGVQGLDGLQGTTGSQGLIGSQGTQGLIGSQGTDGANGTQGTQGTTGLQGLTGIQGSVGLQGTQGFTGSNGSQGIQGTQGIQGLRGLQGIQGSTNGYAQPTEPTPPLSEGALWLDTDGTSTTVFEQLWRKAITTPATQYSGNDDFSLPLSYTVGYEKVYLNGVLLVRGLDYTANDGSTIGLTTATTAGDYLEIITTSTFSAANTYTQAQANATFPLNTTYNPAGKNAVINGGMDVWQRGTSIAQAAALTYSADRWGSYRQGLVTGVTITRQLTNDTTNLPNIQYCARVQRNSGNTSTAETIFANQFETVNSISFAGKTVTMSFYARAGANYSSASNVLITRLYTGTGTDEKITSYTGAQSMIDSTATLTTTWQRFTFTATLGATNTNELSLWFSYNPTSTAGTNDYFEITGVQLELGSVATAFARAGGTIQGELAACQRYYCRMLAGTAYGELAQGVAINATQAHFQVALPVPMRITPSSVDYANLRLTDFAATNYSITSGAIVTNQSSYTIGYFTTSGSSGMTTYRPMGLIGDNNAAGYVGFNAEL